MSIAYVEHPLSKVEKSKLLKKHDKILDIKFAPKKVDEKDKVYKKAKEKAEAAK